jgi:sugar phosphate permease
LALMCAFYGWQQVFIMLGAITFVLAALSWLITRDHPQQMSLPSIQEIEAMELGRPVSEASTMEKIPRSKALRMTFGAGMRFWPLAVWFFFLYGSMMVYQGLWAGPFYHDVLGWEKATYGLVLTFIGIGMIAGCPTAGYISDKILKSRKRVLVIGTVMYTITWATIWMTAGQINSPEAYMAINFVFGFFGGFLVVSFAQIKELFPIAIAGTSTAALNMFPFAGGAILQQASGLMLSSRSLPSYKGLWLAMLICAIIATMAALLSREKDDQG